MPTECSHQYPYSFTWTIENIIVCPLRPGEKLCSPPFIAEKLENTQWRLVLYPRGTKNLKYMSLFLQRQAGSAVVKEIIVDFKLSTDSFVPRFRFLKVCRNICFRENELAGFSEFARLKVLHLLEDSSPTGIFTIRCELSASDGRSRDSTWNKRTDLKSLSQNIQSMYERKLHYDIILRCENLEFCAHKAVLASRSSKLIRDLELESDFESVSVITKDISTISAPILKAILNFLYSGKVDISANISTQDIFAVAEQYELRDLIQKMLVSPKAFQARTVMKVEHKFLLWDVRITTRNQSDALSYIRILSCEMVYVDKLVISCQIITDTDDEILSCATISFRLTGINPERPVFFLCNLHCHIDGDMATDLFSGLHLFRSEEEWKQTFPISDMHLVPDEFLHLSFEIDMCDGGNFTCFQEKSTFPQMCSLRSNDFNQFSSHFGNLLSSRTFSDFTIICGGEKFAAHKAILSARSPVFERMLKHDMMEKRNGLVIIPDIRPNIMTLLLLYIYSGSVEDLMHDDTCDLYEVADKYEIIILKERCASHLISNLNKENARRVFGLADMHFDNLLKFRATKYIHNHKIKVTSLLTVGKTTSVSFSTEPLDLTLREQKLIC